MLWKKEACMASKSVFGRVAAFATLSAALVACAPAVTESATARALAANSPLVITRISASSPNSAGGIDVDVDAVNVSDRTIKYIRYTVELYNAVGDVVADEITGSSTRRLLDTGPYRPGDSAAWGSWPTVFYNYAGRCVIVLSMSVTFADDSTVTIQGADLEASMNSPGMNRCDVSL